ncbi:collectin-10-like [Dendroctonus ponderosae]
MWKLAAFLVLVSLASRAAAQKYTIVTEQATYTQALAFCKRLGLTLVKERSLEDTDALNEAISAAGETAHFFYLGGFHQQDNILTPEWIWIDTGEEITYENWSTGASKDGECLVRTSASSVAGNWMSSTCTVQRYFICEQEE